MMGISGNSIQLPIPIQNIVDEFQLESNLSNSRLLDVDLIIIYNRRNNNKILAYIYFSVP